LRVPFVGMGELELPQHLQAALSDFARRVRSRLGPRLHGLKLFGSWARGEAHGQSDVDVWVLVDSFDPSTRALPFEAAQETLLEHGVDLTATVMDEREWQHLRQRERRIARDIEREGISI
jgi:predicted nucleotidyltransferase